MRIGTKVLALMVGLVGPAFFSTSWGAEPRIGPGAKLETLVVGPTTFVGVQVRSVSARTVTFTHAGGLASIHLRDLSPEWQARFHYDPAAEAAAERNLRTAPTVARPTRATASSGEAKMARLLRQFGQPASMEAEVDLRPQFFQLELRVKNQGRRPSCAVFAVVSALEFQSAELTGQPQKFSEEYLSWATRKIAHRTPPPKVEAITEGPTAAQDDADDGFSLGEVINALRGYGVPLQSSMPNTFGRALQTIAEPPPAVVAEARARQKVFVHPVPGRDNATRINNLVHALNAGVPVVVGMDWPNYRAIRSGHLGNQKPVAGRGHAVTLVGYRAKDERPEELQFIFKNSWGPDWGQGGYGSVSYRYLDNHLGDAVLLEVQPPADGSH